VQAKEPDAKKRKLSDFLEDAYGDADKLEALILEILQDQPTILAGTQFTCFTRTKFYWYTSKSI
jgi:hypothetical protein